MCRLHGIVDASCRGTIISRLLSERTAASRNELVADCMADMLRVVLCRIMSTWLLPEHCCQLHHSYCQSTNNMLTTCLLPACSHTDPTHRVPTECTTEHERRHVPKLCIVMASSNSAMVRARMATSGLKGGFAVIHTSACEHGIQPFKTTVGYHLADAMICIICVLC